MGPPGYRAVFQSSLDYQAGIGLMLRLFDLMLLYSSCRLVLFIFLIATLTE
jgi:hypothetical protein